MNLKLKQIQAFVWVAELGSFKLAAKHLHTTQPNISARIAALEAELNTLLMQRDAGSVRLTQRGRALLPRAKDILKSLDDFADSVGREDLSPGVIRLGVTELIVQSWLPEFLHELKELYPQVLVELEIDLSINIERKLQNYELDLALHNAPFVRDVSGQLHLGETQFIWVCSPDMKLPKSRKLKAQEIATYPILTHSKATQQYQEIESHFRSINIDPKLVPSSSLSACVQLALDGYGICPILATMVESALNSGELHTVKYDWQPQPLLFYARYHAELADLLLVRAAELAQRIAFR